MNNHFHLVLKIGANDNWTNKQVLITWQTLYSLPVMCQRYLQADELDDSSLRLVQKYATEYRARLCSISWFMKKSSGMIFHVSPKGVSLMDETNKAIILSYKSGYFYDLLSCKSPFGLPSAFKFDPVKFSGKVGSKAKHARSVKIQRLLSLRENRHYIFPCATG